MVGKPVHFIKLIMNAVDGVPIETVLQISWMRLLLLNLSCLDRMSHVRDGRNPLKVFRIHPISFPLVVHCWDIIEQTFQDKLT